jgi:hypothetical protein
MFVDGIIISDAVRYNKTLRVTGYSVNSNFIVPWAPTIIVGVSGNNKLSPRGNKLAITPIFFTNFAFVKYWMSVFFFILKNLSVQYHNNFPK